MVSPACSRESSSSSSSSSGHPSLLRPRASGRSHTVRVHTSLLGSAGRLSLLPCRCEGSVERRRFTRGAEVPLCSFSLCSEAGVPLCSECSALSFSTLCSRLSRLACGQPVRVRHLACLLGSLLAYLSTQALGSVVPHSRTVHHHSLSWFEWSTVRAPLGRSCPIKGRLPLVRLTIFRPPSAAHLVEP